MAVNFNLLAPQQGPQSLYQGFEQGQQLAAQNALAQQKMAQEQEMNALRREQAQLGMQQTRAQITAAEEDRARAKRLERAGMFRERLLRAATPEAAREIVKMQYADPDLAPVLSQAGTLEQALAEVPDEPTQFERYRQQEAMGMSEWMKSQLPKTVGNAIYLPGEGRFVTPPPLPKESTPPPMVAEYQFAQTPQGGGFRGSYQDFVVQREAAKRPPPQPRAESAPVAVIDPATGQSVLVSREEALRGRMTPAGQGTTLAPKEIQKREATYPQATQAVKGFETKSESFIKDLEALRNHPGLSQITGIVAGRVPGVTAEGRAAQALYDKIVAKGGFQALQDMRDASKTGGALGNVSNQEGKQLVASFAAIDRRQDAPDVQAAIDQAINDIRGSQARMREAYDETYSYRAQGGAPAAAPAPRARQLAPEDKQALDWANSNPKDPRAAQIKARLGVQ